MSFSERSTRSMTLPDDYDGYMLDDRSEKKSITPKRSILKARYTNNSQNMRNSSFFNGGSETDTEYIPRRNDQFGNEITPKGKKHKICFNPNLVEVNEIENYNVIFKREKIAPRQQCCSIY